MAEHAKDSSFSKKIVIAAVIAVLGYTIASFALGFHDSALTASWFAFWTVELVSLCSIKREKVRNEYEVQDGS